MNSCLLDKSALQILSIAIPLVTHCVYVYIYVYVCKCVDVPFCLNVRMLLGIKRSEKNQQYSIEYFQSNGASPVFLLLDIDLHFQGKSFGILCYMRISRKW